MEKRLYNQWTSEEMEAAMKAYRNKTFGFNECCRRFQIPKPTLKRHLEGTVKRPLSAIKKNGALLTLPSSVENDLIQHILNLQSLCFELNSTDIRRLTYQIAEKHKIPHKFNRNALLAGKKWYYSFIQRHQNLTIKQSEKPIEQDYNREVVDKFFKVLEEKVVLNQISASRIFNVEDIKFSIDKKRKSKIVAQTEGNTSDEELNATLVCCASAAGVFISPLLIFKGKQLAPQLHCRAPAGSLTEVTDDGLITRELFLKWLQHFICCIKPSVNKKIILLLDSHTTYPKNLNILELAQKNGIILLQLPKNAIYRLKPLNMGVFGRMKIFFEQELDQWMTCNTDQYITQCEVVTLITMAYFQAASIENAMNAFKNSGCWPINRFVFNNAGFITGNPSQNDANKSVQPVKPVEKVVKNSDMPSTSVGPPVAVSVNEDEWFCFLCNETRLENMVFCTESNLWIHENCRETLKNSLRHSKQSEKSQVRHGGRVRKEKRDDQYEYW